MTTKKQEMIPAKNESIAVIDRAPKGFEDWDIKDIIIPRIRLLQALSKAVTGGSGRLGQLQDSLTEEVLGDKVEVVLLGMKNGAVYFERGKGMVCKSDDGIISIRGDECTRCPYNEYWGSFKSDRTPPKCSGTKEFIVLKRKSLSTNPYPMLLSFLKTSFPLGKKLASMARLSGDDIFARSYEIGTETISNDKGTFSKFTLKQLDKISSGELAIAEKWYEMMKRVKVQTHEDEEVVQEI